MVHYESVETLYMFEYNCNIVCKDKGGYFWFYVLTCVQQYNEKKKD